MGAPAVGSTPTRTQNRTEIDEANTRPAPKAKPKGAEPRCMDLNRLTEAAAAQGHRPCFGAFGKEEAPSLHDQIETAVRSVEAEDRAMQKVARAAAEARASIPVVSRSAGIITGAAGATATIPSFVVAAAESALRADSAPIQRVLDDASYSAGLMAGEFNHTCDRAKAIYQTFATQHQQYLDTSNAYKTALREQDHGTITRLAGRRQELAAAVRKTVADLQRATVAVGKADARFEAATIHAAEHLALTAVTVGAGMMVSESAAGAREVARAGTDMAREAVVRAEAKAVVEEAAKHVVVDGVLGRAHRGVVESH